MIPQMVKSVARKAPGASFLPRPESEFYERYADFLNPCMPFLEAADFLARELGKVQQSQEPWQRAEILTNIYLLSCTLLNSVEDYLHGPAWKLTPRLAKLPPARLFFGCWKGLYKLWRLPRVRSIQTWREQWRKALQTYLPLFLQGSSANPEALKEATVPLADLLGYRFPAGLRKEPTRVPSSFRKQDLTHHDILALAKKFATQFPDRGQPVFLVGLRTAGPYYVPLAEAFLRLEGYRNLAHGSIRPNKGLSPGERHELTFHAQQGSLAVILDDPPGSGTTLTLTLEQLHGAGFPDNRIVALLPIHPARRDWLNGSEALALSRNTIIPLMPEEWYKCQFLAGGQIENRLREYYQGGQWVQVRLVPESTEIRRLQIRLQELSEETHRTRLKRIFEVELKSSTGQTEVRHVLAKSVGWGYLSYHAYLAGTRLGEFVPPLLGLRDGILFSEWVESTDPPVQRPDWIDTTASYVAARQCRLKLKNDPLPELGLTDQHEGFELLAHMLSKAYGGWAGILMRPRLRWQISRLSCPCPTWIDGRMRQADWIPGPDSMLKTDFEHHGLGKNEPNVTDPAFDLAGAILEMNLSAEEEDRLLGHYVRESGDTTVGDRLFINKLLAGAWAKKISLNYLLNQPQLIHRRQVFHRMFVDAWNFLTLQTVRHCAALCHQPAKVSWGSPLVVSDIDGVLDRRIFGFPSTTWAGIQAVSLLHAHGISIAINSARSVGEVKEYCRAYGFAGGIAEYGSFLWDNINQRGRSLVSVESQKQLETARRALEEVPGIFVNPTYHHSIRAYVFEEDGPHPVPTLTIRQLLADLRLDRLAFHQTTIDTAVTAREVNKGHGLGALLEWLGGRDWHTVAIGDSEPDLAMFRAARRCFAPAQIDCPGPASLLGCRIVSKPYQSGLLQIARLICHADSGTCSRCTSYPRRTDDLFGHLLHISDQGKWPRLLRAMVDPKAWLAVIR